MRTRSQKRNVGSYRKRCLCFESRLESRCNCATPGPRGDVESASVAAHCPLVTADARSNELLREPNSLDVNAEAFSKAGSSANGCSFPAELVTAILDTSRKGMHAVSLLLTS